MSLVIAPSQVDVMTALRVALLAIIPAGVEVVQLNDNGVPMPDGPFVGMRHDGLRRLSTNVDTYSGALGTKSIKTPTQYTIGLDFYGPLAGNLAATVQALFRDEAGVALFPATVVPLHCDDPLQRPLVNGEQNYEQRWRVSAVMQYNPVVTASQDSATALQIGLKPIDQTFTP